MHRTEIQKRIERLVANVNLFGSTHSHDEGDKHLILQYHLGFLEFCTAEEERAEGLLYSIIQKIVSFGEGNDEDYWLTA